MRGRVTLLYPMLSQEAVITLVCCRAKPKIIYLSLFSILQYNQYFTIEHLCVIIFPNILGHGIQTCIFIYCKLLLISQPLFAFMEYFNFVPIKVTRCKIYVKYRSIKHSREWFLPDEFLMSKEADKVIVLGRISVHYCLEVEQHHVVHACISCDWNHNMLKP